MKTFKVTIEKGEYDKLYLVVFAKNAESAKKKSLAHVKKTMWAQHTTIEVQDVSHVNGVVEIVHVDF